MMARSTAGCVPVWLSLPKLLCPVMDTSVGDRNESAMAAAKPVDTGTAVVARVARAAGRGGREMAVLAVRSGVKVLVRPMVVMPSPSRGAPHAGAAVLGTKRGWRGRHGTLVRTQKGNPVPLISHRRRNNVGTFYAPRAAA